MSFEPTPAQALLLFGLLAKHGECRQAEIMPAVVAKDREALAGAKLIAVEKVSRTYYLALTDAGWGWAGAHLAAELPSAHGTLHDLLLRLREHLSRSSATLADFIGSKPVDAAEAPVAAKRTADTKAPAKARAPAKTKAPAKTEAAAVPKAAKTKTTAKPKMPTAAALRKRIGEAYLSITGGVADRSVKLSRLRAELSDLDRSTVDAALGRILAGDKKASLMRHDDPRQLSEADHAAAFSPAGEPFHVIWIAS